MVDDGFEVGRVHEFLLFLIGGAVELVDDLEDAGEADDVLALDAADGLHGADLGPAAQGDGFDLALPFQQVGYEGAGGAALAVSQEEVVGEGLGMSGLSAFDNSKPFTPQCWSKSVSLRRQRMA